MNATKWATLSQFAKHLDEIGLCRVEETEKDGLCIAWIDNSPRALEIKNTLSKKKDDESEDNVQEHILQKQISAAIKQKAILSKGTTPSTKPINMAEDYILECEQCLQTLLEYGKQGILADLQILDTLVQTRKNFGRTALVLSGGSILGLIHVGVMRELLHNNLLPRIVSGSSAGSIFASILCIHLDHEIDELFDTLIEEKFDIFEETGKEETINVRFARFLKYGTVLDNKYLANTLQGLLGNITFQEAYNRTRKILNVTVSPASIYESARILNYLTSPNVLIWSAVCASCSVPFVFPSYVLLSKDYTTGDIRQWSPSPLKYIDGSVDNDIPLARLSELFNVNHFIACQVNPHVAPIMKATTLLKSVVENMKESNSFFHEILITMTKAQNYMTDEISHFLLVTHELGLFQNLSSKLRAVISQQYAGDITILPEISLGDLKDLFKNPTKEKFLEAHLRGQRALWPKMSLIRNRCAIELALDKSIHELRKRMLPLENNYISQLGRKNFYSTANLKAIEHELTESKEIMRHSKLKSSLKPEKGIDKKYHYRHKSEGTHPYSLSIVMNRGKI
ncbi:uncharacterized protein SAPINGB_P001740 [Magnusiomyces paraingens]|uniref:PNPLA domain-containing protein n=1 Tax=Magnusiomyces paraingens TaxID=2606893 RepID=A0A5E8B9D0_9ASCO|nr:uncharacterized protein SAPINGB_P001740 [Saprochaete ingens]VVT47496.1 unnamed protein product [Saprochaete ingens]